jgi:hypothetical protein
MRKAQETERAAVHPGRGIRKHRMSRRRERPDSDSITVVCSRGRQSIACAFRCVRREHVGDRLMRRGNLRFNWRIVHASTRLLDHIVAHELVLLVQRDHTRDFWATLGRLMPDYEARRERLRLIGRAMAW